MGRMGSCGEPQTGERRLLLEQQASDPSAGAGRSGRERIAVPTLAMLAGMLAWLWPIGVGGKMLVGGDVTEFSIGLMAVLHRSIRAGRLPLWNDLWGYGFPGVAESQMGVFYPPHVILFGLFSTETAHTANLVLHTLWCALGAAWAARRFGISAWGSVLAGFTWATSGFFLIHLPHQWAYTGGSWMPWAWGLAWTLVSGKGCWRTPWALAAVLAIQILPGHFQLAFCTEVGVLGICLCALAARPAGSRRAVKLTLALIGALACVVPLAAMQLWPTLQLARLAERQRDFEYLSGFAATPLHLVSYFAPGLFHRSPLWRSVAWDPFHTSPEEHLAYVGLVPLFLALGAIGRGRRDAPVRLLAVLAAGSLILSLGPYVPGFEFWSALPGFSFFRAPARWSLATGLALALLAGRGFDEVRNWPRPGRSLFRFLAVAVAVPFVVVLGFELALASSAGRGWPRVAAAFERAMQSFPWSGDDSFRAVMAKARRPPTDPLVQVALARAGINPSTASRLRLSHERFHIYVQELRETGLLIVALLVLAPLATRRRLFTTCLIALTAADLWCLGQHRTVNLGPIAPLTSQSRVLARLASEGYGTRSIDTMRNLAMVAGAAPVLPFRTLDLPVLVPLGSLARAPLGLPEIDAVIFDAIHATGARVRIIAPSSFERVATKDRARPDLVERGIVERIDDPVLAGWLFGAPPDSILLGSLDTTFTLCWPRRATSKAWLISDPDGRSLEQMHANVGESSRVIDLLKNAQPLAVRADVPERWEVPLNATGPATVLISQLAYPEWSAVWSGPGGARPAPIVKVFGGWQAVRVPGPGPWTLHFKYRGRDVRLGLAISVLAWSLGTLAFLVRLRSRSRGLNRKPSTRHVEGGAK